MTAPVRFGLRAKRAPVRLARRPQRARRSDDGARAERAAARGTEDFGLDSAAAILAFVVAFGAAKALTSLAAGELAERLGRKRLLVAGVEL